jgi:hypothetical protein
MACYLTLSPQQTAEQRKAEVAQAIKDLEAKLFKGEARVVVGPNGAIAFVGKDRDDISDVCILRSLTAGNSYAFKQALAKAEMLAGRRYNPQAVNAGVHSHDGGKTWGPGHR